MRAGAVGNAGSNAHQWVLTVFAGVQADASDRERLHQRLLHVRRLWRVYQEFCGWWDLGGVSRKAKERCMCTCAHQTSLSPGARARAALAAAAAAAGALSPSRRSTFSPSPISALLTLGSSRMPLSMMSSSSILGGAGGLPLGRGACCCEGASATALMVKARGFC